MAWSECKELEQTVCTSHTKHMVFGFFKLHSKCRLSEASCSYIVDVFCLVLKGLTGGLFGRWVGLISGLYVAVTEDGSFTHKMKQNIKDVSKLQWRHAKKKRGVSNGFPPTLQKHEHEANWECEIGHEIVGFLQVKMLVSVVVCLSM